MPTLTPEEQTFLDKLRRCPATNNGERCSLRGRNHDTHRTRDSRYIWPEKTRIINETEV